MDEGEGQIRNITKTSDSGNGGDSNSNEGAALEEGVAPDEVAASEEGVSPEARAVPEEGDAAPEADDVTPEEGDAPPEENSAAPEEGAEVDEDQEDEEEQQIASFPEEDSMSRDGTALDGLGDDESRDQEDQDDQESKDPMSDKIDFVDEGEGQSLDAVSIRSEEPAEDGMGEKPDGNENKDSNDPEVVCEESNDSKRSNSSTSKDKETSDDINQIQEPDTAEDTDLRTDEVFEDEEDGENLVSEVDISSMMEINFDEESENSQSQNIRQDGDEPEVIPIDSDDDDTGNATNKDSQLTEESYESQPIALNEAVYQVDEDENITEVDVSSMMQTEFAIDDDSQDVQIQDDNSPSNSSSSTPSRRPRRAAAEAAAKTIHQISTQEEGIPSTVFRTRRKSQEDSEYNVHAESNIEQQSPTTARQKCHVCRKMAPCSIVIRQYGSDMYLCSNTCFNKFRNQGKDSRSKTLPCSKCGVIDGESSNGRVTYFWETMNFCSDLCVGRYQMDVGSKCCTCGSNVPWTSLGKYCVRFGSDIRQFCIPQCLENYKKNARVCFNCQLDIRRVGNVILANIPSKSTPKEFCSNDCVEMYCERNMHQPTRAKPQPEHPCFICQNRRPVHRELVLNSGSFKVCSEYCWRETLIKQNVAKSEKCEMCAKFVNMDLGFTTPVYWLSTINRIYGFCSHICKNLYILNNRKIMSCTSCKVKKYNYDLIELFNNTSSTFGVCSLACIPKSASYIKNIRDVLYIPQPNADRSSLSSSFPAISAAIASNTSLEPRVSRRKTKHVIEDSVRNEIIELDDEDDNDEDDEDIEIADSDRILDILTLEEIAAVVEFLENRPRMRSVECMAKPRTKTVETQTDISELNDMERITLVPDDVVHYVPVPIPTLVHVPFPGYFLESACPIPFPVPIPIPIPIPVIIPTKNDSKCKESSDTGKNDDQPENDDDPPNNPPAKPSSPTPTASGSTLNSNTNTTNGSGSSTPSRAPSETQSEVKDQIECVDIKITPELIHQQQRDAAKPMPMMLPLPNTPLTPNSLATSPDFSIRGSAPGPNIRFSSPQYTQDNTYSSSIYPSPISNYSPSYSSSPVPPLTPVAPVPVSVPSYVNHNSPIRDYGAPSVQHVTPQMSNSYPSYGGSPRSYIQPAPMMRQPVPVASGYSTHSSSMGYNNAPPHASLPISTIIPQPPSPKNARVENALRAWKMMFGPSSDPRSMSPLELSSKLCDLANRGHKPNGERYRADILLCICLGVQQLLRDNNRVDKIFYDNMYYNFVLAFTDRAERELTVGIYAKLEETHFWETSELGASSPGVLLFTLIFMFYKYFGLKTWEMHAALQFNHIVIQSRYDQFGRFGKYISVIGLPGTIPTEIHEDTSHPDRCLIKVFEFYCFKSEIRDGPFYKCLRQDYTPRTPWFTSQQLDQRHIYQMLVRASMISNNNTDGFS